MESVCLHTKRITMKVSIKEKVISTLRKSSHKPLKINTIVLEFDETHIEVNFVNKQLTYRHVTSSTRGGERFPEGYFDNHNIEINNAVFLQIKDQLQECISKLPFERELEFLPPGASRKAYMRYVDIKGNNYHYSTAHISKSGFSVESTPVHKEFKCLYEILLSQCEFPEFGIANYACCDSMLQNNSDSRYFEETLWLCKKCGSGNLFENSICINCGEDRGW